ncbi:MAG: hypothetical protein AAFS10_04940 [Myxococcota bacterium]
MWASSAANFTAGRNITAGNNITAGQDLTVGRDATVDRNLRVNGRIDAAQQITPSVGGGSNRGITFPSNPGGGTGDGAWIRYLSDGGGENMRLSIAINNDGNDELELYQSGSRRLWIENGHTNISNDLRVNGRLRTGDANGLKHGNCRWQDVGLGVAADDVRHETVCDDGEFMVGWGCKAERHLDGDCRIRCCRP